MFNFGGVTHVIKNPAGGFSLVGSVPTTMMEKRVPTVADIMGGRAHDGFAYVGKTYQSIEDIKAAAATCGANLCTSPTCACHALPEANEAVNR